MGRGEREGEAPNRLRGEPGCGFARDMSGVVVENDLNGGIGGVGRVKQLEELDEFLGCGGVPRPSPGQACMGLLVSTDLMDSVCAFGGLRMVVLNHRLSILLVGGPVGMWAKASISPLSSLLGKRGKRSRSAPPIVHISTGGSCRLCRGVTKASG